MVTKKQHYYPRSLLKHFGNPDGQVFAYVCKENKIVKMKTDNLCYKNYTYEIKNEIDNTLEKKLSNYEGVISSIVKGILNCLYLEDKSIELEISEEHANMLYQYLWLQVIRTDSGRINYVNLIENCIDYTPRKKPMELYEIEINKDKINKFNKLFKQDGILESFLSLKNKPDNVKIHIAISEKNIISSDNPVIGTDMWKQLILPITPNVCIIFQHESINSSDNLITILTDEKVKKINEAMINTANYYVFSKEEFTFEQNMYLYNRFNNANWEFLEYHFPRKNNVEGSK